VRRRTRALLAQGRNTGFAVAANRGLLAARTEFVALVNTDVVLAPDWIEVMAGRLAEEPRFASVACKMCGWATSGRWTTAATCCAATASASSAAMGGVTNGRWDAPGEVFGACGGRPRCTGARRCAKQARSTSGSSAIWRTSTLALRLQLAGWRCAYEPRAVARHAGGGSSDALSKPVAYWTARNAVLLIGKHWPARWLPYVAYRQLSWLDEAARRGTLAAHLRGLLAGLRLLPASLGERSAWRTKPCASRRRCRGGRGAAPGRVRPSAVRLLMRRMAWLGAATLLLCGCTMLWQVEPHDEGLMLAWAGRIARRPGALPRLLEQLRAGPAAAARGAGEGVSGHRCWRGACCGWRWMSWSSCWRTCSCAGGRGRAGAIAGSLATAGAMAFPAGPGPNSTALALGLGAIALAPRRALAAGALAGLACFFRPEIGIACALGAMLEADSRRVHIASAAAAVAAVTLGPFVIALGGYMLPQTVGFVDEQRLQRLPFPLVPHVGLDPNKLLEFWMPLILVLGCAAWLAVGRRRWSAWRRLPSSGSAICSRAPTSSTSCRSRWRWRSCSRVPRPLARGRRARCSACCWR